MSATDELRRMLDERGVPWKCYGYENHTWWGEWHAENRASVNGLFLKVEGVVTPEQAIDATLGVGTCKLDGYTDAAFRVVQASDETDFIGYAEVCECTACGASVIVPHEYERVSCERDELWPTYNYCPHCGAKVIAPTTNNVDAEVGE